MELMARRAIGQDAVTANTELAIETAAIMVTLAYWLLGFGWVSRRFEREADLFGARCVTPTDGACNAPCAVHSVSISPEQHDSRVCATGAAIFTSALDRVAALNGIPRHERSWRHSSIGSRIRFLTSLAGDPNRTTAFERLLRRIKCGLLATTIVGGVVTLYYFISVSEPAILRLQTPAG